ncbi:MAG TPA: 16S rRNA (guanine(527)-N(7))-methyltransferase RsmG [Rhodospirillales bacterium]|nr:16S rRNA (guanine(527)-N(7))-methyltransferase RsmG [Rhodospirillales bacterium]
MSAKEFQETLNISEENMEKLAAFLRALEKWNKKINLVGAASLKDPWRRHMLDSAQLLTHIPKNAGHVVDIGSGAGFPGLVLAALGGFQVHLVESDSRKCVFLNEVNRLIHAGAGIQNRRIEAVRDLKADIVTARACAPLKILLDYAFPLIKNSGKLLFLKGKKAEEELTESKKKWTMSVQSTPSISDPSGVILILENISYRHG